MVIKFDVMGQNTSVEVNTTKKTFKIGNKVFDI